jgi:hypothetical protein
MNILTCEIKNVNLIFFKTHKLNAISYVLFFGILAFSNSFLISKIRSYNISTFEYGYTWVDIIGVVIIAPFIETLLFFHIPFGFYLQKKINKMVVFLLMTLPFSFAHYVYGISGIIAAFISSLIFANSYFLWSKNSLKEAIVVTTLTHVLHNILVATWNIYFQ